MALPAMTAPWRASDGRDAPVQAVVLVGGQRRRGVRRRDLEDAVGRDLVDDGQRDAGRGSTDDGADALREVRVDRLRRDVRRGVARVAVDRGHRLAVDATRGVDLRDGLLDARELRWAEEGKVTGLRQQGADDEGRVLALGWTRRRTRMLPRSLPWWRRRCSLPVLHSTWTRSRSNCRHRRRDPAKPRRARRPT